jgi:putative DNA primase/helicase
MTLGLPPLDPEGFDEADWTSRLLRGADRKVHGEMVPGPVLAVFPNLVEILRHDPAWKGVICLDEFANRVVKRTTPPLEHSSAGEWTDADDLQALMWLSRTHRLLPKKADVFDAVQAVADMQRFHEPREYLQGLVWDGIPRVRHWVSAYLGAQPSQYHEAVSTKWLVSAVARVMRPGVKADGVLILEGAQGLGKSTALAILGGPWFTDAPFRLGDREGWMVIQGKWIVELGELDAFNKSESTSAKQFFSQYVDRFRSPWSKRPADVPRQSVFAGTTNQSVYLKDDTGNRRYWPVLCEHIDFDELRADRDQLWAEAVHLYRNGTVWHVQEHEREQFEDAQASRMIVDAYDTKIRRWLAEQGNQYRTEPITMADILSGALGLDAGKWTRAEQTRVGQVMSRMDGWTRKRASADSGGHRDWIYVRDVESLPRAANDA